MATDDKYERIFKDWNERKEIPPLIHDLPPDAPKWRGDALRFFMSCKNPNRTYSIAERVKDIAWGCFKTPKTSGYFSSDEEDEDEDEEKVEWKKGLLDELEEYDGESIDVATLLHSRGMLSSFLLDVFSNKHACIRAKAAELVTSMVQNHPTSQQLVIQGNGIQLLLHNFTTDPDATSRTKALGAISSLIRNNESGIAVFLREDGYEALKNALKSGTVLAGSSTHNEVVNLIGSLRRENNLLMIQRYKKQEKVETRKKEEAVVQAAQLEKNGAPLKNLGLGPPFPPATGSQILHQFL